MGTTRALHQNFPIQGSAADMTKTAMVRVTRDVLPKYPLARLIMQIHDELIFEYMLSDPSLGKVSQQQVGRKGLESSEIVSFQSDVVTSMQNAVTLSVPVVVTSSIGHTWSELK